MKAVVQRVRSARVLVDGEPIGAVGTGLCVLLGVAVDDGVAEAERMAAKVASLRIFENAEGKLDLSVSDAGGAVLAISQFTLIADTAKGNRPSFSDAARPDRAEFLYRHVCEALAERGIVVATGMFGARMLVEIENEGPVTIVLET